MNDNLFSGEDLPEADENLDYLSELVGEGKKFKDVKDLAKGKFLADKYIAEVVKQKDEMYNDLMRLQKENNTKATLEALIDRLEKRQQLPEDSTTETTRSNVPAFDPKQVEEIFANKLTEYETTKKQQENLKLVKDKLVERFGDNFKSSLKKRSDELGLTEDYVNNMAAIAPKALFAALRLDERPSSNDLFQAPPRSNEPFRSGGEKKRTWSYYQDLKKAKPDLYWDPRTQVEMINDHERLGSAFEDGDYERLGRL